ncbi:hypothetical protein G6F35_012107 [Rhizopus arrhizus]|nr:hypothetical protein G6F35_012107 [Rhizopus arrhizus]
MPTQTRSSGSTSSVSISLPGSEPGSHQAAIGGGPDVALAILGQRQHHARGHAFGRAETAQAWCFRHFKGRSRCGERHQQQPHSRDASPPQAPAARHPDPPVLGRLSHRPGFMTATACFHGQWHHELLQPCTHRWQGPVRMIATSPFRSPPSMRPCLALLPMLLATAPAWADADTYRLDPVHTRVLFSIDHAGYSQAMGTVSGSEGRLQFDPDNWREATLDVEVPVSRLDLGDAKWNQATLARSLLDGERFPNARFVSSRVEPIDARRAHVIGTITLRGSSQEITLEVTLNAIKRYPLPPFRRTGGFSASTTLSRRA